MDQAPADTDLRNIIDKLAQFVARNGPEFEQMTKNKQKDNPKFSFLFGGEYFNYYQYKVTTEQAILKQKGMNAMQNVDPRLNIAQRQQQQQQPQPHAIGHQSMHNNINSNMQNNGINSVAVNNANPVVQNNVPVNNMGGQGSSPGSKAWLQTELTNLQNQQTQLQDQINQSEQNLAAQHTSLMSQQQGRIEDAVRQAQEEMHLTSARNANIDLVKFNAMLQPIIDTCTKDSISAGKAWILQHAVTTDGNEVIAEYLLKNARKKSVELRKAMEKVVVPMFCNTSLAATDEQLNKLNKLLSLWESKNNYFDEGVIDKLKDPSASWAEYQSDLMAIHADSIATITSTTKQTFDNYQTQHQAFVNHAMRQIQTLEQQKVAIEQQIKALASAPPVVPPTNLPPPAGHPNHEGAMSLGAQHEGHPPHHQPGGFPLSRPPPLVSGPPHHHGGPPPHGGPPIERPPPQGEGHPHQYSGPPPNLAPHQGLPPNGPPIHHGGPPPPHGGSQHGGPSPQQGGPPPNRPCPYMSPPRGGMPPHGDYPPHQSDFRHQEFPNRPPPPDFMQQQSDYRSQNDYPPPRSDYRGPGPDYQQHPDFRPDFRPNFDDDYHSDFNQYRDHPNSDFMRRDRNPPSPPPPHRGGPPPPFGGPPSHGMPPHSGPSHGISPHPGGPPFGPGGPPPPPHRGPPQHGGPHPFGPPPPHGGGPPSLLNSDLKFSQPPPGWSNPPNEHHGPPALGTLPDLSKPPPNFAAPPPFVHEPSAEDLLPSMPYFDLPAGLMVPLIKLEDGGYKALDPDKIRLPPPAPPSERLIAAVEAFYAPPNHDSPRDSDGWEKLGLYEYYKAKNIARKRKEEDIQNGLREKSRSRSPINRPSSKSPSPPKKRYRSKSRSRSRSKSRGRSKSKSPPTSNHRRSSRSNSSRSKRRRNSGKDRSPDRRMDKSERSPTPPSFFGSAYNKSIQDSSLDESNRGHQLLKKMGWGGAGLGANEQGIENPISGGDVRDKVDQYKGVGISINDPYENFRKSKGQAFITRMKARAEERAEERDRD